MDLFFVLSGYLISNQLFQKVSETGTIQLKDFFIKRSFRIIPAYIAILIIYFTIPAFREREALSPLWKFLTFTQNFGLNLRTSGTFSHAWSLCIEEQFYFILPMLLLLFLRIRTGAKSFLLLPFFFIAGFACRILSWKELVIPTLETDLFGITWYKYIYYPTYNRLDGLLMGVSIAAVNNFAPGIKTRLSKHGNMMFLLGLVCLTGAYFLCLEPLSYTATVYGFPLVAVSYGLMVAASINPSCFFYKINSRITTFIAALSYAIYLSHKGVVHVTQEYFAPEKIADNSSVMFVMSAIASILAAIALRFAVEKPFLKIRDCIIKNK